MKTSPNIPAIKIALINAIGHINPDLQIKIASQADNQSIKYGDKAAIRYLAITIQDLMP